jgi:hypothetical protein
MPKKKQQFVALFHLQWKTAKATVPPNALKRCDFSKGLGPVLDTLEKKWDAAADLDPVPPKTLSDLKVQVEKFQKIATGYRDEIVKANTADPGNGPGWLALRNALQKIDEGVVMDMKDLGVVCAKMKNWPEKSTFDRAAGKIGPGDGAAADSSDYRKQGFRSLAGKLAPTSNDPVAFGKALTQGVTTCFPNSKPMRTALRSPADAFSNAARNYVKHITSTPPNAQQIRNAVAEAEKAAKAFSDAAPAEGNAVATTVMEMAAKMKRSAPTA